MRLQIFSLTLVSFFCLLISDKSNAQIAQYHIGGPGNEIATRVRFMPSDNSTIIAGYTYDYTGGVVSNCQAIILKVNSSGSIVWQKTFGMAGRDNMIMDMIITQDGNIVVVGVVNRISLYSNNTAAILKFNGLTGNIMWQNCVQATPATTGGEIFTGITELTDGTGRLVAVGSADFSPTVCNSMLCVFQSNGTLIYNEIFQTTGSDWFECICTSNSGNSVYIGGIFLGNYNDGRVLNYTPGATSGTVNWAQYFDFTLDGSLQSQYFPFIYLSGTKLVISSNVIHNYSTTAGAAHAVLTINASDGSSPQLREIKNSGLPYSNNPVIAVLSEDHIFTVQSPSTAYYDPVYWTTGVSTDAVVTEITSLSAGTFNTPVKFTSTDVGTHSFNEIRYNGGYLYMAGQTDVTSGFGNNDIYYVVAGTSLASINAHCDTVHDNVVITNVATASNPPVVTVSSFTPVYSTVDTGISTLSIGVLCADTVFYCNTLTMPDSLLACQTSTDTIHAVMTGSDSILNIKWSPAIGLSDTTILSPIVTVGTTSGWYYLTVKSILPGNFVVNGNFSAGNTGFSSSYTYVVPSSCAICPEGVYTIITDPSLVHPSAGSFGDHTTGTGNMMAINGASSPIDVWCETINVVPNTDYDFSAWVANWGPADVGSGIPILQFRINGVLIGTPDTMNFPPNVWHQFYTTWNSGAATTATICIYDAVTVAGGNDFALDDIAFQQICVAKDSIYVSAIAPDTIIHSTDTTVCASVSGLVLVAPAGYGSYIWSTGSTGMTITATTNGTYWVRGNSACSEQVDTTHLTFKPLPVVTLGNDTSFCEGHSVTLTSIQPSGYTYLWSNGNTTNSIIVSATGSYWLMVSNGCAAYDTINITVMAADTVYTNTDTTVCANLSPFTLNAPAGYLTYLWSTGSATTSINVTTNGTYWVRAINGCFMQVDTTQINFRALPFVNLGNDTGFCSPNTLILSSIQPAGYVYLWSTGSTNDSIVVGITGNYWLQVSNGCIASDTINVTISPVPVVNLGPDTLLCFAQSYFLQSAVTYTTPVYLWSDASTGATLLTTTTGTYWLQVTQSGCSGADTVQLTFIHDSMTLYNPDTVICLGQDVQILATGNPSTHFQWVPTSGIGTPTSLNPLIVPDTSSYYFLYGSYAGCPTLVDSIYIDVQPSPIVNIGGNRSVCQFDTLHINSLVTPQWYTHYNYLWSPSTNLDYSNTPDVVFTPGGYTVLVLNVRTPNGCWGADSAIIYYHPGNFATLDSNKNICPGDSVKITATGGISYRWTPTMYLSDSAASAPWVHAITSIDYTMIATSAFGCHDTMHVSVNVRPGAMLYVDDSATIFEGESYLINTQSNCVLFSWFPGYALSDYTSSNPVASPAFNTKYIVTATTAWGCTTKDSISIYVDPETIFAVPNAFTPGNGPNNLFKLIKKGQGTLNSFRIYNRWGETVFETNDVDKGWDGTYHGQPQPFGVYVYVIDALAKSGKMYNKLGNLTLIR